MMEDRFLKRLRKKARKGLRGWPIATVAFYGPNLSQATKVTVGIVPSENADVKELRDWKVDRDDIRADPGIAQEILEFIDQHRVLSVAMTDSIIGCPHQEGIDYEGEWCPACEFGTDEIALRGRRSIRFSLLVPRPRASSASGLSVARASQNDRLQPRADIVLFEALPSLRTAATAS